MNSGEDKKGGIVFPDAEAQVPTITMFQILHLAVTIRQPGINSREIVEKSLRFQLVECSATLVG